MVHPLEVDPLVMVAEVAMDYKLVKTMSNYDLDLAIVVADCLFRSMASSSSVAVKTYLTYLVWFCVYDRYEDLANVTIDMGNRCPVNVSVASADDCRMKIVYFCWQCRHYVSSY